MLATNKLAKNYPLTTVGALVKGPSGRVLIVKTTKWRGSWGVPGGKVDWGETLEAALIREVQDEVVFFFFKQKTAYEIVSRDWSSDVCSSDLA